MPDAPVMLANVPTITSATKIGLSWENGPDDGGLEIQDYIISSAAVPNEFTVLEVGVKTRSYTAISLTPGVIYKFKVQARNVYGNSDYSEEVFILAAQEPD